MPGPLDDHFQLAETQAAEDRMRKNIALLQEAGINYVVEGGWAVAAYGSPTPSVDLDVLIPSGEYDMLVTVVKNKTGIQLETGHGAELLSLDWTFSDDQNPLFGKPNLSYIPEELLRNRIDNRSIQTVRGIVNLRVPRTDALIFMKLKAFRDRALQWALSRDRIALAALPREEALVVNLKPTAYWERKAGKDLYDVCYLMRHHPAPTLLDLFPGDALDEEVKKAVRQIPPPLAAFADGMARRSRVQILPPNALPKVFFSDD